MESSIQESDITIVERVACGGCGDVYKASWKSAKHGEKLTVAVKQIPLKPDTSPEDQIEIEVDILKSLDHKNVIKYYGLVVTKRYVMIVTEFASKGSLQDYLQTKMNLPLELANKWAIEAAQGIKYLRQMKIVHRDIKSANFVIAEDNTLKICDFGIAKVQDRTRSTRNTEHGTLQWLAPEVFMSGLLSPKSDVYSFGIVLWELHSCQLPYHGLIPQHVMFRVAKDKLRPKIPDDCPAEICQLIEECWAQERNARPPIDEVVDRLTRFAIEPSDP